MHIQVKIKSVYGNELIYPMNEQGRIFCELTKTKTLTRQDINLIKQLGYTFEVVQANPTI